MIIRRRGNKYGVAPKDRRTLNGKVYPSRAEMLFAVQLEVQMMAGDVIEVIEQPSVRLGVVENRYVPDFLVIPKLGLPHYVDVKGTETAAFRKNKKLWASYGRLNLHIVKYKNNRFATTQVIKVV